MRKILIFVIIAVLSSTLCWAKTNVDTSSIGMGARGIGLGRSYTAIVDDANTVFSNPAGLGYNKRWSISSMSTRLLDRVNYQLVGGSIPLGTGTIGLGYISAGTSAGYYTTDKASLSSAQAINYQDTTLLISYGLNLNEILYAPSEIGSFCIGITAKIYQKGFSGTAALDQAKGNGLSVDIGFLLVKEEDSSFGLNIKNAINGKNGLLWESGTKENLPTSLNAGLTRKVWEDKLLISLETNLNITQDRPVTLHIGTEYTPINFIALRLGLDQDPSTSGTLNHITAGVGLNYRGFSFDYAFRQDSQLEGNNAHFFSLTYVLPKVDTLAEKQKKDKESLLKSYPLPENQLVEPKKEPVKEKPQTAKDDQSNMDEGLKQLIKLGEKK